MTLTNPDDTVDAGPARRHIRNLNRKGMTVPEIAAAAQIPFNSVTRILYRSQDIRHDTAQKLLAVKPPETYTRDYWRMIRQKANAKRNAHKKVVRARAIKRRTVELQRPDNPPYNPNVRWANANKQVRNHIRNTQKRHTQ